ncbi:gamma-BHC dehydrochlorinase [Williamsia sp. 1138]|nr:gamma-BHC dehydrochlorinase [Williamsia sp. 1138]
MGSRRRLRRGSFPDHGRGRREVQSVNNGPESAHATETVRYLADRQAILDVVSRYCRGIDRIDADLVRSCYHEGAVDHHIGFTGTVNEFISWCFPLLRELGGTRHVIANHLCEVNGDVAVAESYVLAYHWQEPYDDRERNFAGHGRYVDRFERGADGHWRIAARTALADIATPILPMPVPAADPDASSTQDPSYSVAEAAFRELRVDEGKPISAFVKHGST